MMNGQDKSIFVQFFHSFFFLCFHSVGSSACINQENCCLRSSNILSISLLLPIVISLSNTSRIKCTDAIMCPSRDKTANDFLLHGIFLAFIFLFNDFLHLVTIFMLISYIDAISRTLQVATQLKHARLGNGVFYFKSPTPASRFTQREQKIDKE